MDLKAKGFLSILLLPLLLLSSWALAGSSYAEAKKQGLSIYQANPKTFYCERSFDSTGRLLQPEGQYLSEQATRIQWEHLVPAKQFGVYLTCWHQSICRDKDGKPFKGRRCCQQKDALYQKMEADLHNLVPVLPKLNQARSDYRFQDTVKGKKPIETCPFQVDKKHRTVSVDTSYRGFIARAYLYMYATYGVPLTKEELQQYERWNRDYPPSRWEIQRNRLIREKQGTLNPYIVGY